MPWPSTPPEIAELLITTCGWEKFLGFDGHAEPSYAPRLSLQCFQEAHSMLQTGLEGTRQAEQTWSDPDFDLYFAGDNKDAQTFSLYDRFAFTNAIGEDAADLVNTITQQPSAVNTIFGPFDNKNPWLIVVSF